MLTVFVCRLTFYHFRDNVYTHADVCLLFLITLFIVCATVLAICVLHAKIFSVIYPFAIKILSCNSYVYAEELELLYALLSVACVALRYAALCSHGRNSRLK